MGHASTFNIGIGNDFVARAPKLPARPVLVAEPAVTAVASPISEVHEQLKNPNQIIKNGWSWLHFVWLHRIGALSIVFVMAVGITIPVWYSEVHSTVISYADKVLHPVTISAAGQEVAGNPLSFEIPTLDLSSKLHMITSQSIELTVGASKAVKIPSTTISSWIKVTKSSSGAISYLNISSSAVGSSVVQLADQSVTAPVDALEADESGINTVIYPGTPGTKLADPSILESQASSAVNNLFSGNGFQLSAPVVSAPAPLSSVTSFPGKLLDANVTTKRMYAFDNGQLVNTFLISAGKPSTPTPIGEFHIWAKLASQTMTGPGYVQPNVPYVNYFDHSGDAVHGNYWRPASYFGNVNSSHGCVGVQVPEAEWIYNWAPIGTTVITHA